MAESLSTIRRRIGAKVGRMTPEEAEAKLAEIRELTGGYVSQALNDHVTRALARQAWSYH